MGDDPGIGLREAAAAGNLDAVKAALAAGVDVNARGEYGDTALNAAAEAGHALVAEALIAAGADIENLGGADKTPLMCAAFAGQVGVVRLLLGAGARITNDLLDSLAMKVGILEENAENGMVLPEAAARWRQFLDAMVEERLKQDAKASPP